MMYLKNQFPFLLDSSRDPDEYYFYSSRFNLQVHKIENDNIATNLYVDNASIIKKDINGKLSYIQEDFNKILHDGSLIIGYPHYKFCIYDKDNNKISECDVISFNDRNKVRKLNEYIVYFYSFTKNGDFVLDQIEYTDDIVFNIKTESKTGSIISNHGKCLSPWEINNFIHNKDSSLISNIKGLSYDLYDVKIDKLSLFIDSRNRFLTFSNTKEIESRRVNLHRNSSMDPWDEEYEEVTCFRVWTMFRYEDNDFFAYIGAFLKYAKLRGNELIFNEPISIKTIENISSIHFFYNRYTNRYYY